MKFLTRDEVLAEATKCIDRAFAEGKHSIIIAAQIREAPIADFTTATWSTPWNLPTYVVTLASVLVPTLRAVYASVPDSPLRTADKILCDFLVDIREADKRQAEGN